VIVFSSFKSISYYETSCENDTLYLTYHFFYAFDSKDGTRENLGNGYHPLDRESFTIELKKENNDYIPLNVTYAGHLEEHEMYKCESESPIFDECIKLPNTNNWSGKVTINWENINKIDNNPIVYFAKGAHAIYPSYGWYHVDIGWSWDFKEEAGDKVDKIIIKEANLLKLDITNNERFLNFSGFWVDGLFKAGDGRFPMFTKRAPYSDWLENKTFAFENYLNNACDGDTRPEFFEHIQCENNTINTAPILSTIPNPSDINESATIQNISLSATDEEDDNFTFTATSLTPSLASAEIVNTNELKIDLVADTYGEVTINVKVTQDNNTSLYDEQNITFNVLEIIVPTPKITLFSPTIANEDESTTFIIDGENLPQTIAMSLQDGECDDVNYTSSSRASITCIPRADGIKAFYVAKSSGGEAIQSDVDLNVTIVKNTIITHNGYTYKIMRSKSSGRLWLDRNLGANSVCSSYYDSNCFGSYFQWGRNSDGHEDKNSSTTSTLASDVNNTGHSDFITAGTATNDWATDYSNELIDEEMGLYKENNGTQRALNWSKTDGSSVCPNGFRVPTFTELSNENLNSDSDIAFDTLKLPSAGYRYNFDGTIQEDGHNGFVWSTTIDGTRSKNLTFFNGILAGGLENYRAMGQSVRCIQDDISTIPVANAGENQVVMKDEPVTISASDSFDTDGNITSYEWRENNTTISNDINYTTSNFSLGEHNITLIVTDNNNTTDSDTITITILDKTDVVVHDGYHYGMIESNVTNRIWLNKNIGANRVCTTFDDSQCFGDYFQWGRNADGHEDQTSSKTPTLAEHAENVGHSMFITPTSSPYDWSLYGDEKRSENWSKTDGSSVCPAGFRVPTMTELEAENINWSGETAFNQLKLPSAGYRDIGGDVYENGNNGYVWSTTRNGTDSKNMSFEDFTLPGRGDTNNRASGQSVRCIKD
jgi:hypothetical protein